MCAAFTTCLVTYWFCTYPWDNSLLLSLSCFLPQGFAIPCALWYWTARLKAVSASQSWAAVTAASDSCPSSSRQSCPEHQLHSTATSGACACVGGFRFRFAPCSCPLPLKSRYDTGKCIIGQWFYTQCPHLCYNNWPNILVLFKHIMRSFIAN